MMAQTMTKVVPRTVAQTTAAQTTAAIVLETPGARVVPGTVARGRVVPGTVARGTVVPVVEVRVDLEARRRAVLC